MSTPICINVELLPEEALELFKTLRTIGWDSSDGFNSPRRQYELIRSGCAKVRVALTQQGVSAA